MGRALLGALLLVLLLPLPASAAAAPREAFLVSFDGPLPAVGDTLAGARVIERFPFAGVALLEGPAHARATLASAPRVAGVYEPEPIALAMERERRIVGAEPPAGAAWPSGASVTVAIVDSGIEADHPALDGRVLAGVRISRAGVVGASATDADGHGTHVAGIVGGDGTGSAQARHHGIAPGANLVGVDISDSFTTTNAVRAFAWIHDNAERYNIRVVSNSWGREKEDAHYDENDPVIRASDALVAQGLVVVFSAGNRGRDGASTLTTEAMNPNVITVGAASAGGHVESYSSRGPAHDSAGRTLNWNKPDLVAPGTAVVSTRAAFADASGTTDEERYYTTMNGTSMAAPQVAAAAALLLDAHPRLTPGDVAAILQRSAADLGPLGADPETGHGMLDVAAALREARFTADGERRIVVEKRVPLKLEGSVTGVVGQVLVAGRAPQLPPQRVASLPLELPAGSAAVDLWFNWSGEGGFDARLVGPAGPVAFERISVQSLRLTTTVVAGTWRIEAIPSGAAHHASYTVAGTVLVREEQLVEVAAEAHGRRGSSSGAFVTSSPTGLVALDALAAAPLLGFAIAATFATLIGLAWRARKDAS